MFCKKNVANKLLTIKSQKKIKSEFNFIKIERRKKIRQIDLSCLHSLFAICSVFSYTNAAIFFQDVAIISLKNWFFSFICLFCSFGNLRPLKKIKSNAMESLPSSDVVIVHGNSHPELANLIAG